MGLAIAGLTGGWGPPPGVVPVEPVPALWAGLDRGPHGVGFTVLFATDSTRAYADSQASPSSPFPAPGRPLRLFGWYPTADLDCTPMRLGDLLVVEAPEPRYERWNRMLNERAQHLLRVTYGTGDSLFEKLRETPLAACRGSEPAAGPWPWVVYSHGSNAHQLDNLVLFEYLASHGFVVVSVPQLAARWPETLIGRVTDPVSTDAQLRDLEFAIALAREHLPVEPARLGLMGFSGGGLYALLLSGKSPGSARAVVTLDGSGSYSHAPDFVADEEYFADPGAPGALLDLHKQSRRLDLGRLHTLSGLRRYHLRFDEAYHLDFTSLPLFHRLGPEEQDYYTADELAYGVAVQRTAAPLVRSFLGGALAAEPVAAPELEALCAGVSLPPVSHVVCVPPAAGLSPRRLVLDALAGPFDPDPEELDGLRRQLPDASETLAITRGLHTFYLLDEAETVLTAAARLWPEEPKIHLELASIAAKRADPCARARHLDRAHALHLQAGDEEAAVEAAKERRSIDDSACPADTEAP